MPQHIRERDTWLLHSTLPPPSHPDKTEPARRTINILLLNWMRLSYGRSPRVAFDGVWPYTCPCFYLVQGDANVPTWLPRARSFDTRRDLHVHMPRDSRDFDASLSFHWYYLFLSSILLTILILSPRGKSHEEWKGNTWIVFRLNAQWIN